MGVSAAGSAAAIRSGAKTFALPRSIALTSIPPTLITRDTTVTAAGPARRTKIWEFNINLHCSIVGTCLSAGELRQILKKLGLAPPDSTDHELHGTAVTLAARHDNAARLLNKALDNRHRLAISQFAKVGTEDRVRELWREAVRRGEIPGAYWATLTHPAATPVVLREAFGDVHMLSHLVGAANRADIRRLCQLEADKVQLEARLERQQRALHEAVVMRDLRIQELREALAQRIAAEPLAGRSGPTDAGATEASTAEQGDMLLQLVRDLERRLASETRRRVASDTRLATAQSAIAQERSARLKANSDCESLRAELDATETSVVAACVAPTGESQPAPRLDGTVLLYVGGRPHQVAHLRAVGERLGATFLHHDGGIENHPNLLPGLTSRADLVLFPVDCISHDAAHAVKLLCRQAGKRFIPLRAASVTSLLAALRRPDMTARADAAN
jgi:Uncharacterized protein conserved in bacteria (DUF2325)